MKTRPSRRETAKVSHSRWLAYATASAATALAGGNSAEAAIHYSGRLEVRFLSQSVKREQFRLDQHGDHFSLSHFNSLAKFEIAGFSHGFRGFLHIGVGNYLVSKLSFGQYISSGSFVSARGSNFLAGTTQSQWGGAGVGFIGFKFNGGAGIQYGWARVRTYGFLNNNGFKLIDYAYADPGEAITAGETGQDVREEEGVEEGSLGGLALGAVGLLAWRKSRSRTAPFKNAFSGGLSSQCSARSNPRAASGKHSDCKQR
jgi:hypothetical protein